MKIHSLIPKILGDPKTVVVGVLLGFVSGLYFKDFSHGLKPLADIYVSLLSMCILPILVSALVWGVGQMLRHPRTRELFGRMAIIYGLGLLIPCFVALSIAVIFRPGASWKTSRTAAAASPRVSAGRSSASTRRCRDISRRGIARPILAALRPRGRLLRMS